MTAHTSSPAGKSPARRRPGPRENGPPTAIRPTQAGGPQLSYGTAHRWRHHGTAQPPLCSRPRPALAGGQLSVDGTARATRRRGDPGIIHRTRFDPGIITRALMFWFLNEQCRLPWFLRRSRNNPPDTLTKGIKIVLKTQIHIRQPGPRRPTAYFQSGKKEMTQKSPIRCPCTQCGPSAPPRNSGVISASLKGSPPRPSTAPRVSASLEGSEPTLERAD